ncbi:MAG: DUF362 domain-containing protein [Acidobacteriaceae bacterium]|nr:DUF362 domain-containing protein [Acidobacteriaceae bacterium]
MTRRHFFFGSLALAACSRAPRARRYNVSVVRAASYSSDLVSLIRRLIAGHGVAVAGKSIVLKPNLVEFSSHAPANTHPVFVAAVYEAFRSLGARHIRIAEGPGHRRATLDMAYDAGFFAAVPGFENSFVDLNLDDVSRTPIRNPASSLSHIYLPNTVLNCDLLVSLPKMKTHHWAGATLSMKNLFGVVPGAVYGWPKNVLHWSGIDECIVDLNTLFPRQFCIVDGIQGMEGNGPILGTRNAPGVIVAGSHPPSVDATCCRVMQIDPNRIGYLRLASRRTGWSSTLVDQIGENIRDVSTPFALIPAFRELRLNGA